MTKSALPVLLDAHALGSELGGNERYIRGLLEGFNSIGRKDRITLALNEREIKSADPLLKGWKMVSLGHSHSRVERLFSRFPQLMAEGQNSLLHVTAVAPPLLAQRVVVTVHDILFEDHPSYFPWQQVLAFRAAFRLSAATATRIITISDFTARRLMEIYHVSPKKITVTPLGVSSDFCPQSFEKISSVCIKYGISGKYLLAVGNLHPRKNLYRLGLAYKNLAESGKLDEISLVLVGKKTWRAERVLEPIRELIDSGKVLLTGYVDDSDLPALYSGAEAFIYPSLFEGFGIPPLEAMACGTPVIAGFTSSLPEVCGDAACWVDPLSLNEIQTAILRIILDDNYKSSMMLLGLERAKQFNWERTASLTEAAYIAAISES